MKTKAFYFVLSSLFVALLARSASSADIQVESLGNYLVKVKAISGNVRLRTGGDPLIALGWKFEPLFAASAVEVDVARGTIRRSDRGAFWTIATPVSDAAIADNERAMRRSFSGGSTTSALRKSPGSAAGWDAAHKQLVGAIAESRSLSRAATDKGLEILAIEPNLEMNFRIAKLKKFLPLEDRGGPENEGVILGKRNVAWPGPKQFAWHLADDRDGRLGYTQLSTARARVSKSAQRRIKIAHLDTGYDPKHITRPRNFNCDLSVTLSKDGKIIGGGGRTGKAGHGTGTLGILAGGKVVIPGQFHDDLGGAPDAEVFEVKIDSGAVADVIHLATAPLAAGIDYAVAQNADVISLSAGGVPSRAWADAVNNAYEAGTAIFAAAGNFFAFPILGFPMTPRRTVYPAAFPRVEAVTGATASHRSYGKRGTIAALLPWNWGQGAMRGSYGPLHDMDEAVAGYSPNITWARYKDEVPPHRGIEVDGSGTSCATPQVAAAAALWLAYHAAELPPRGSSISWQRAEAVYQALEESTHHTKGSALFGKGLLRAAKALEQAVPENMTPRPAARAGLEWLCLLLPVDCRSESARRMGETPSKEELQSDMFQLEAAQLIARSEKLYKLAEKLFGKELDLDEQQRPLRGPPEEQKIKMGRLAKAIASHQDCSDMLREKLRKAF